MNSCQLRNFGRPIGFVAVAALCIMPLMNRQTSGQERLASASGHGHLRADAAGSPDPEGELRTFSFHAMAFDDGVSMGQAQLKNRASGLRVHIEIDCMVVVDNLAIMSGVVEKSNQPDFFPVTATVLFAVEDNGEGKHAAVDRITPVFIAAPEPVPDLCIAVLEAEGLPPDELFAPIEGGNIQVKP